MSDPRNALGGADFSGLVSVLEQPPIGMITLKGDLGSAQLRDAVTSVTGSRFPGPLEGQGVGLRALLWMAPDEILLMGPYAEVADDLDTLGKALSGSHVLAVDVSDARSVFVLEGDMVREVLAKLTPADMHPDAFPAGAFRRTRLGQVAAAIWMKDDCTAQLICFRSVAQYVFDLLSDAARPDARVDYF